MNMALGHTSLPIGSRSVTFNAGAIWQVQLVESQYKPVLHLLSSAAQMTGSGLLAQPAPTPLFVTLKARGLEMDVPFASVTLTFPAAAAAGTLTPAEVGAHDV